MLQVSVTCRLPLANTARNQKCLSRYGPSAGLGEARCYPVVLNAVHGWFSHADPSLFLSVVRPPCYPPVLRGKLWLFRGCSQPGHGDTISTMSTNRQVHDLGCGLVLFALGVLFLVAQGTAGTVSVIAVAALEGSARKKQPYLSFVKIVRCPIHSSSALSRSVLRRSS